MNHAAKCRTDAPDVANNWKIAGNRDSKTNVFSSSCYLLNCNVAPMIFNVDNNGNDGVPLSNLIVRQSIGDQTENITRLKNTQIKIDFSENGVDAGGGGGGEGAINVFACNPVKYDAGMLLQVELSANDATTSAAAASTNNVIMSAYNSSTAAASENVDCEYKRVPMLSYSIPPPPLTNVEQHSAPVQYLKCSICDKEFSDEDHLKVHITAHGQRSKSRRCDYCELTLPSKGKWYAHFKTHFNDPSFECAFCNCAFVTHKYLQEHLKFHLTTKNGAISGTGGDTVVSGVTTTGSNFSVDCSEERTFPCTFCNKEFADRSGILFHLRIHTADVVFRCMHCGKMFLNKSELNLHVRVHTGDKAHVCHLCHKTFLTTSNLKQHLRIHTGDKPFCCTSCHKAFSNKSNLMQHIKVHTGEKPYRCKFCDKSFTTTSNLTQHLRTHTGVKPYVCEDCGKAFINKSNLSQHRKVHRAAHQKNDEDMKKEFPE